LRTLICSGESVPVTDRRRDRGSSSVCPRFSILFRVRVIVFPLGALNVALLLSPSVIVAGTTASIGAFQLSNGVRVPRVLGWRTVFTLRWDTISMCSMQLITVAHDDRHFLSQSSSNSLLNVTIFHVAVNSVSCAALEIA
jgi:hypothetical protein